MAIIEYPRICTSLHLVQRSMSPRRTSSFSRFQRLEKFQEKAPCQPVVCIFVIRVSMVGSGFWPSSTPCLKRTSLPSLRSGFVYASANAWFDTLHMNMRLSWRFSQFFCCGLNPLSYEATRLAFWPNWRLEQDEHMSYSLCLRCVLARVVQREIIWPIFLLMANQAFQLLWNRHTA